VAALAKILVEAWEVDPEHQLTFVIPSLSSPKLKTQGLAVEMLLHLDRFVDLMVAGNHLDALALMLETTKYVSELTLEAVDQLGTGEEAAQVINRIREGAARGGLASAESRRRASRIPAPSILRAERDRLIGLGKAEREIAGMLAKTHGCSADHIRKILKAKEGPSGRD
jgi:hypothetical protein